jgi:hypothetical protein
VGVWPNSGAYCYARVGVLMALFDALLTPGGGAPDSGMADAGTAADILKKKFPGMFPDAPANANGNAIPLFATGGGGAPTVPPAAASGDVAAPDVSGQPNGVTPNYKLPWMREFQQAQRPPISTPTGQWTPGTTKAQKLEVMLRNGLQGAIAGMGADAQAVIASGGRRSGGFGLGAAAGFQAPAQQTATQQELQRGALTNQQLAQQVQFYPQTAVLGIGKTISDIQKNQAEAGKATAEGGKATAETGAIPAKQALEQAQALAARYKEDPGSGSLIDLQTGQPVTTSGIAPLTAEEATVLGKQPGERVPIKLKNVASEIAARGLTTVNTEEGVFERNRITGTNTRLGNNPREISLDTPVGALDNTTGKQVMVTRKDIINNPGRFAPVSADVSTPVVKQTLKEYASTKPGTAGGATIAFNTAMAHLGLLNDAIDALGNNKIKIFNSIAQKYKEQTGSTVGATFDTVKQAVSGELAKVTGSLSQGEQEAIKGPLDKSNSPQALKAAVRSAVQIMDGKIGALHQHYVDVMHEEPDAPLISPEAAKVRDKLLGSGGQIQVTDPKGGVHTFPDQASADQFKRLARIQ